LLRIGAATAVVTILVGIGLGLAVVGIVWLRRILQDPEAGPSPWRYHKWD
jgi:hypothetical protein